MRRFKFNLNPSRLLTAVCLCYTLWFMMCRVCSRIQVLDVEGENSGAGALRDIRGSGLLVSRSDFDSYIARSRAALADPSILVAEPNDIMAASYILLDGEGPGGGGCHVCGCGYVGGYSMPVGGWVGGGWGGGGEG
jgi:hypothetical protein